MFYFYILFLIGTRTHTFNGFSHFISRASETGLSTIVYIPFYGSSTPSELFPFTDEPIDLLYIYYILYTIRSIVTIHSLLSIGSSTPINWKSKNFIDEPLKVTYMIYTLYITSFMVSDLTPFFTLLPFFLFTLICRSLENNIYCITIGQCNMTVLRFIIVGSTASFAPSFRFSNCRPRKIFTLE